MSVREVACHRIERCLDVIKSQEICTLQSQIVLLILVIFFHDIEVTKCFRTALQLQIKQRRKCVAYI